MTNTSTFGKIKSTAAVATAVCALAALPPAPTAISNPIAPPVAAKAVSTSEQYIHQTSILPNQTVAPTFKTPSIFYTTEESRPATQAEKAIGELRAWGTYDKNWDGEDALTPDKNSISSAVNFIFSLPQELSTPEPMLHANGRVGLFWETENLYADLEFYNDGRVTYFVRRSESDKSKGVTSFDGKNFPSLFSALLT